MLNESMNDQMYERTAKRSINQSIDRSIDRLTIDVFFSESGFLSLLCKIEGF